ncbi:MAG: hypothetical protein A3F74_17135 [Betaproteobacteria bacterium RIFCSPLOWO2_12_FULL_62_58]|nr:MAG: hypothetical protein A3I62_01100 [Betaproteobacteria bacterium RIFCSPLOWO2_02_FULL_62_79]OGA46981.1 MAG: hypothetical protein A3F74_17135 [Betaproteobacteria bacterium RIFCSPLOWO2_12_FULL_62_58]
MKREIFGFDAFSSSEIAERVEAVGVTKARLPLLSMAMLGVFAKGFIGLGALYSVLVALVYHVIYRRGNGEQA